MKVATFAEKMNNPRVFFLQCSQTQNPKVTKNRQRKFNGLTLNIEFISQVWQEFLYFHECEARVKYYKISHEWNKFHMQRQNIKFSIDHIFGGLKHVSFKL